MNTSDVLNRAADLIEERRWEKGDGWPSESRERRGAPLCLEGGIAAAMGLVFPENVAGPAYDGFRTCPAYAAVRSYLGWEETLWRWNDKSARTAAEVIETLRACAVIEAAKEAARESELNASADALGRGWRAVGDIQVSIDNRLVGATTAQRLLYRSEVTESGCREWMGKRDSAGYGQLNMAGHKAWLAHRLSYETFVGPIPEGLTIDHLCENPPCINPEHLEPVTNAENMRRRAERRTHCLRGHEISEANSYTPVGHRRRCRVCDRLRARRSAKAAS